MSDAYHEHSVLLNSVAWRISEALGRTEGKDRIIGDVIVDLETLIAERDAAIARAERAEADADRLAESLRNTVEEFYGEDGSTYNPEEWEALAAHDALVAEQKGGPA